MNNLLITEDAARYMDVHVATLATWRHEGRGPKYLKIGRNVRYRRDELDRWLESQTRTGTRI